MQKKLRDEVWPYGDDWGEEKDKVRDYLRLMWEKNIHTEIVTDNIENVRKEKDLILQVRNCILQNKISEVFPSFVFSGGGI